MAVWRSTTPGCCAIQAWLCGGTRTSTRVCCPCAAASCIPTKSRSTSGDKRRITASDVPRKPQSFSPVPHQVHTFVSQVSMRFMTAALQQLGACKGELMPLFEDSMRWSCLQRVPEAALQQHSITHLIATLTNACSLTTAALQKHQELCQPGKPSASAHLPRRCCILPHDSLENQLRLLIAHFNLNSYASDYEQCNLPA